MAVEYGIIITDGKDSKQQSNTCKRTFLMDYAPTITCQCCLILSQSIMNHCAVFWRRISPQTHGSVTQTEVRALF